MNRQRDSMDRRDRMPLYAQLAQIIRQRILSGEIQTGDPLPTERELMEDHKLSRFTVRQAINMLVNEGLVFRDHGRGTFVSRVGLEAQCRIDTMIEHGGLLALSGYTVTYEQISANEIEANARVRDKLEVQEGEAVVCSTFIFYADGRPAIFTENYILASYLEGEYGQLDESGYGYIDFLEAITGRTVRYIAADIIPVVAEGDIAERLNLPECSPLLLLEELFVDASGQKPLGLGRNFYHPEIIHFSVLRK